MPLFRSTLRAITLPALRKGAVLASLPVAAFLLAAPAAQAQNQAGDTIGWQLAYDGEIYGGPSTTTFAAPSTTLLVNYASSNQLSVKFNVSSIVVTVTAANSYGAASTFNGLQLTNNNPRFSGATVTNSTFTGFTPETRFSATSNQLNFNFQGLNSTVGQSITVSLPGASAAAPEPGSIALLLTAGVPVVGLVRRRVTKL